MFRGISLILAALSEKSDRLCRIFLAFCFAMMISVCLLQVFCRYALDAALSWPEELTIYLMVWMTFIGAAVAVKSSEHISVDVLLNLFPRRTQARLSLMVTILTLLVVLYLLKSAFGLTVSSVSMISDALGISMLWPRVAMPISASLMVLHLANRIMADTANLLKENRQRG